MDEKMEDTVDECFQYLEIDLDYEFDASRYFDFRRRESLSEAREAELWFETAGSYPPSPYIVKLHLREDVLVEDASTLPEPKDVKQTNSITNSDVSMGSNSSGPAENYRDHEEVGDLNLKSGQYAQQAFMASVLDHFFIGSIVADSQAGGAVTKDIPKAKTKSVKPPFSSRSTLMKPTASQLAKQNPPRFQKPMVLKNERSLDNTSGIESQAAKRQKLEGGHLRKVLDLKQQVSLIHKAPQKDGNSDQSRLKLTIPREPELETARRAQRMRAKSCMEVGERTFSTVPVFKARRLNRKILEAPSMPMPQKSTPRLPEFQEFRLKTSERAMQHVSSASSPLLCSNNSDKVVVNHKTSSIWQIGTPDYKSLQNYANISSHHQKLKVTDDRKQEESEKIPQFKARPLNKKIFSSKGEIGVFRTSKRQMTIPMEFNFPTDKRFQNPPIELFKKLSLTCELKQKLASQSNMSRPVPIKENMVDSVQKEQKINHTSKDTLQRLGGKQVQCGSDRGMAEIRSQANVCRSVGIR
ncbi:protein TPX2-like isoform X2 [Magnolia sinica]|uniref:protein TPX2-like isoform X2 n=1 Tax=Magnolia sinica TaxID=86752 RepID=UPI0026580DB8|nr:protein TPX2-like isoform X2 [Magnolia sinica]